MVETFWTDEDTKILKELWARGLSQRAIAEIICKTHPGITRNAIAGRVSRLKLRGTRLSDKPCRERRAPRKPSKPPSNPIPEVTEIEAPLPPPQNEKAQGLQIEDLTRYTCHWIVGDVKSGAFYYCGEHTRDGSAYCEYHHGKVYRPAERKKGQH